MASFRQIMVMCLQGASYSQITSSLGCSRRDVARVKAVIADESITQEVFDQLPPEWFSDQFSDCRRARKLAYDQPDFKALADKLKNNKHLTRHKLWMDYLSVPCPTELAKYQYSQFCDQLRAYIQANDLVEVVEHSPGLELYVDWAGDKVAIIDQATGEVGMKASLFVAVCPYSGLMFVTACPDEKMASWITSHVQALEYVGKLPQIIVPDNAATATYRPKKHSTYRMVTDRYADFAAYYDITIVPTRPGKPRDKAAVERAVKIAYTKILGYFDGDVFYSLDELNEAIAVRIEDINTVMTRADGTTRRQRFDDEEAPMMRDLPPTPFTQVEWKRLKVDRNWHVTCDYQYYSVPFWFVGQTLTARLTPQLVSIFNGDELVAEHTRLHGFKYRYSTDPQHSPQGESTEYNVLTRSELIRWATSFGPATTKVITMILDRNSAAQPRGLLQARNVLANLGKKHHKTTLEPACQIIVDKQLAPMMAVIKRIQTDIAHTRKPQNNTADAPHGHQLSHTPVVEITEDLESAVFLRPADYYDPKEN